MKNRWERPLQWGYSQVWGIFTPVLGITTIPLYVISLGPLWMPFDTAAAAESRNYYSTKIQVERDRAKALRELDHKLEDKQLSYEQHLREQRLIEAKYSAY